MAKIDSFTKVDNEGNITEYTVLFTFESGTTHKNYIVYTDDTRDENGNINVYAGTYNPQKLGNIETIETEEEWETIEDLLEDINQKYQRK